MRRVLLGILCRLILLGWGALADQEDSNRGMDGGYLTR